MLARNQILVLQKLIYLLFTAEVDVFCPSRQLSCKWLLLIMM